MRDASFFAPPARAPNGFFRGARAGDMYDSAMVRRKDPAGGKRILRAGTYFAVAMVGMFGSFAWVILTAEGGRSEGWASVAVLFFLLAVFGTTVNVFRVMLRYRCPKCRARIARLPGATPGDPVLYRCPACNVEWDTGWTVTDSSD